MPILADEVYGDLGFDGPAPLLGSLAPDAPIISFSSLSKAYLAPGWRAGWLAVGRSDRLDDVLAAIKKLAGRTAVQSGPDAVRDSRRADGRSVVPAATFVRELRQRAELTVARLSAIPGMRCVAPRAAFYAMPQVALPPGVTDEDYVLGLLRATGVLCVYGSGFGLPADQGFLRIVFLAPLDELGAIYDDIAAFTGDFLQPSPRGTARRGHPRDPCPPRAIAISAHCPGDRDAARRRRRAVDALQIRGALLVIYISAPLALGFNPIIRVLERQPVIGNSRLPRWAALLVLYFGLLAVAIARGAGAAAARRPIRRSSWGDLPNATSRGRSACSSSIACWIKRWALDEILKTLPAPSDRAHRRPRRAAERDRRDRHGRRRFWCCRSTCWSRPTRCTAGC